MFAQKAEPTMEKKSFIVLGFIFFSEAEVVCTAPLMNNLPWRYLLLVVENCATVLLEILPWGTITLLQSLKAVHLHNNGNPALEALLSQNNVSSLAPEGKFCIETAIAQIEIYCKCCLETDYFCVGKDTEISFCPWSSLHISVQNGCYTLWERSSVLLMPQISLVEPLVEQE